MQTTESKIDQALRHLQSGEMIIIADKEDRENEGDIFMAASLATAEKINFMITHCKGLVCAPLTQQIADKLYLPPMWSSETHRGKISTNFTIAVDHESCTTGISASERACTLRSLADPNTKAENLHRPGHIFPLVAHPGGLAAREGHTEVAIKLLQEAGLPEVGVICEIINPDGTMARAKQLKEFAQAHSLAQLGMEEVLQRYLP